MRDKREGEEKCFVAGIEKLGEENVWIFGAVVVIIAGLDVRRSQWTMCC